MQDTVIESDNKDESKSLVKNIFKPNSWLSKIDFINHLVLFNNVMITVLAEQGGGKTTFIDLLQASHDINIKSHVMKATAPFNQESLLAQLSSIFYLRTDIESTVANLIQQINERKAYVLVIIDDAQHLSDDFLREILIALKQQGENGFFHLCLVSDFSLVASLNKLEAESFGNLIHTLEPGVLTESEMKTYLLNSLPSPKRLDKTMSDKRLEQFYQLTGGNIARINKQMINYFCPEALGVIAKQKSFSKRISVIASFTIVLLASAYIWNNQDLSLPAKSSSGLAKPQVVIQGSVVPAIPVAMQAKESALPSQVSLIGDQMMNSYVPAFYIGAISQPVQPPPLKRIVNIVLDDDERDDSMVVMDKVVVIPKALPHNAAKRELVPELKIAATPREILNKESLSLVTGTKSKGKGQYTIQLLASSNVEDIKRFISTHHISGNVKIRQIKKQGANWYVLTMGEYAQFEEAKIVANNLPAGLSQFKPWIRSISGLTIVVS